MTFLFSDPPDHLPQEVIEKQMTMAFLRTIFPVHSCKPHWETELAPRLPPHPSGMHSITCTLCSGQCLTMKETGGQSLGLLCYSLALEPLCPVYSYRKWDSRKRQTGRMAQDAVTFLLALGYLFFFFF